jgi:hypothetical protein
VRKLSSANLMSLRSAAERCVYTSSDIVSIACDFVL